MKLVLIALLLTACGTSHQDVLPQPAAGDSVAPGDDIKPQDVDNAPKGDNSVVVSDDLPTAPAVESVPAVKYLYSRSVKLGEYLGDTKRADWVAFKTESGLTFNVNAKNSSVEFLVLGFTEIGCQGDAVILYGFGRMDSLTVNGETDWPSTVATTGREFWKIGDKLEAALTIKSWGTSNFCQNEEPTQYQAQYIATKLDTPVAEINDIYSVINSSAELSFR